MENSIATELSSWFQENSGAIIATFIGTLFLCQSWKGLLSKVDFYAWYILVLATALGIAMYYDKMYYFFVFFLGMLTAFGEIINKFKDEPIKALPTPYALSYIVVNGAIAVGALKICILINNNQMPEESLLQVKWILLAGLGSMLIMRSKFFDVKVGDKEIAFGPEQIINIYLEYLVTSIDRYRALNRIDFIKKHLRNIHFEKAVDECTTMLESAPQVLGTQTLIDWKKKIAEIKSPGSTGNLSSYRLGFVLLNAMGEGFVEKIFISAPPEWRMTAPTPEPIPDIIPEGGTCERLWRFLSSESPTIPYFAYGRSMASNEFRKRLNWTGMTDTDFKKFTRPRTCELEGYRLEFNKTESQGSSPSGRANLIPDHNGKVKGVLYDLTREALDFLDHEETGYKRIAVEVKAGTSKIKAEALIAEYTGESRKPAQEYLNILISGAKEHGIDQRYIETLRALGASTIANGNKPASQTTIRQSIYGQEDSGDVASIFLLGTS